MVLVATPFVFPQIGPTHPLSDLQLLHPVLVHFPLATRTFLGPPQVQHQQVGDAPVLREGEAQGRFGLAAGLGVSVHAVDSGAAGSAFGVPVDAIRMAVHSARDSASCRRGGDNPGLTSATARHGSSSCSRLMSGVSTRMMDLLRRRKASFTYAKEEERRSTSCGVKDTNRNIPSAPEPPTSSQQCMRAMPSERRIMLSSCRTVILQADLVTPPELSRCRRRLYCSTMNSFDSTEIYTGGCATVKWGSQPWTRTHTHSLCRLTHTHTVGLNCLAKSRYLRISSSEYSRSTDSSPRQCRSTMRLAMA
ncbi:hypothetical protein EYF80_041578 [Liparis tanakae]|uniref:Uncharacterized protein n=1 Tax=Liparis tanakae TaxID=230148 RepID=A0A4Z2G3Y0_9TELE|nr:hypothetical protein EYF80_041578 [Liparis tanakae]